MRPLAGEGGEDSSSDALPLLTPLFACSLFAFFLSCPHSCPFLSSNLNPIDLLGSMLGISSSLLFTPVPPGQERVTVVDKGALGLE